ncbi:MAG: chemotaxis protein CheW [Candidatus Magasanikbacteria bacterium]|nr:chemotaxis protein CheW [Candidatus Magasanikbacteria bacterium]
MAEDMQQIVASVAQQSQSEEQSQIETMQLIVFTLDGEEYAVPITDINEILTSQEVTTMPNAPAFVSGIINVRGTIAVVIDLEKRFGLQRENQAVSEHIILTEVDKSTFGVLVDQVLEVLTVPKDSVKTTPELLSTKINAEYMSGVVVLDEDKTNESKTSEDSRLIVLLNLPKLLQTDELLTVTTAIDSISPSANSV